LNQDKVVESAAWWIHSKLKRGLAEAFHLW
jgi:hypothetical protein